MCLKFIKMGVNGVPVAPHGLILGGNEAAPSRKFLKHLPGSPGPVFGPKTIMNGVPVAPHGLILGENGATASRKLSKHLQAPFPPAWGSKRPKNIGIEELGENT